MVKFPITSGLATVYKFFASTVHCRQWEPARTVTMNTIATSSVVLMCIFGGALARISLRAILPEHQLSTDSRDVVKLGAGLVGTMAALVLGLLVASAKGSYDAQSGELTEMSGNIALLDRILELYGPETGEARGALRNVVGQFLDQVWTNDDSSVTVTPGRGGEIVFEKIQALSPKSALQHTLQNQALSLAMTI
jgi:hypothetical protein